MSPAAAALRNSAGEPSGSSGVGSLSCVVEASVLARAAIGAAVMVLLRSSTREPVTVISVSADDLFPALASACFFASKRDAVGFGSTELPCAMVLRVRAFGADGAGAGGFSKSVEGCAGKAYNSVGGGVDACAAARADCAVASGVDPDADGDSAWRLGARDEGVTSSVAVCLVTFTLEVPRGRNTCGATTSPATAVAASVPNNAGRHHQRPVAVWLVLAPVFLPASTAVRSAATRAACASTAPRTQGLVRLGSSAETRR